jgi:uncharacterized protein (DUF433 family)
MKKQLITRSKEIMGGTPVFTGTRVPVRALIDYLEAGRPLAEFLDDFPSVNRSQAIGVLELIQSQIDKSPYERAA